MCLYEIDPQRRRRAVDETPRDVAPGELEGVVMAHRPRAAGSQPVIQGVLALGRSAYRRARDLLGRSSKAGSTAAASRLRPGAP